MTSGHHVRFDFGESSTHLAGLRPEFAACISATGGAFAARTGDSTLGETGWLAAGGQRKYSPMRMAAISIAEYAELPRLEAIATATIAVPAIAGRLRVSNRQTINGSM